MTCFVSNYSYIFELNHSTDDAESSLCPYNTKRMLNQCMEDASLLTITLEQLNKVIQMAGHSFVHSQCYFVL